MDKPKFRVNSQFIGFFCDERTKERVQTTARLRNISVTELLRTLAENCDTLVWYTELADRPARKRGNLLRPR